MLTRVDVSTPQGDLLSFQLDDDTSGFIVKNIDGLDPVKATLTSSNFAGVDGAQYQSSRRETRNILIKLGLEPDPLTDTVRGLRNRLYGFFMPKAKVDLKFYDDEGITATISGVVEDAPTPLFTETPEMVVSIICFEPDFLDTVPGHFDGTSVSSDSMSIISYPGTSETGTIVTLNVNRSMSDFTIYHQPPNDNLRQLDFSASLLSGDVLTISSVKGDKGIILNRGGTESSLLYGMSPQSSWIELMPGVNHIRLYATGAGVPYTIDYTTRYGAL